MANKRIKDLDSATLLSSYKLAVDIAGLSEAEQCTIAELSTALDAIKEYPFTLTSATQGDQITHSLDTNTPQVWLYDNGGVYVDVNGLYAVDNSNNITFTIGFTISGTWRGIIKK